MTTFSTQPRSMSLDYSIKKKREKKSHLRRYQFCFALPQANPVSGYKEAVPSNGQMLDLNSISITHSGALWPYSGHFMGFAAPSAPSRLQAATLCHPLLTAVLCIRLRRSLQNFTHRWSLLLGVTNANQPKGVSGRLKGWLPALVTWKV